MSEKEYKEKCKNMFAKNTILLNENIELKKKLCLMRKYIYGNYDLEYKEMQLQHIDEFGTELVIEEIKNGTV